MWLNLALCDFIDPDLDLISITKSEGDMLRTMKRFKLGFIGALFVSWWFLYAYIISLVGSHRSKWSHSLVVGTIGRQVWFNIPIFFGVYIFINHSITIWGTPPFEEIGFRYLWMTSWLKPYLITQFVAWTIGDGIHLFKDKIIFKRLHKTMNIQEIK